MRRPPHTKATQLPSAGAHPAQSEGTNKATETGVRRGCQLTNTQTQVTLLSVVTPLRVSPVTQDLHSFVFLYFN